MSSEANRAATVLLAAPNFSEGRDGSVLEAVAAALGGARSAVRSGARGGALVLDRHADPDHHRAVFTIAGWPGGLAPALAAGADEAIAHIDLRRHEGVHPRVGAIDVVPIVHLDDARRGAACVEALLVGELLGELGLPVLLYGALAAGRTRAQLRGGGIAELSRRIESGELVPDFGPRHPHPSAGVTLVGARPPLVAFNVELAAPATAKDAREAAARVREGGRDGLPGVRALGLELSAQGIVQVSTNVEDPLAVPLAAVLEAVARSAPVAGAELVGLAPRAALEGFPDTVALRGAAVLEDVLANALTS
ncbi:MAG: glutamate formimidoyltransferase [Solirubrobacteraceae bacterium]|nr:MAG: glutamate formiminotransferase [Solirubrobacterales bacterium]